MRTLATVLMRGATWMSMVIIFCGGLAGADVPLLAPMSPAWHDWVSGKYAGPAADGFGYVPDPADRSHLRPQPGKDALPARFDLRDSNGLTSVKYQSACGACWAFAACSALESWVKIHRGETRDFSENHMKNSHGFEMGHCAGGNNSVTTAYLARWSGPLLEADDPYVPNQVVAPAPGAQSQKLMLSAPIFTANGGDRAEIQQAVMTYGALSASMTYRDQDYNSATHTYYHTGAAGGYGHMIAVVGWDDAKAVPGAPGPGAWICKNSWANWWGEAGYFYISYYDVDAVKEAFAFIDLVTPDTYGRLYEYDPLGLTGFAGSGVGDTAYGVNVFTAVEDETIVAVGTHAVANNTSCVISVYVGGINAVTTGAPAVTSSHTFAQAGYYVVDLPQGVAVGAGQQFSVKIRYETPDWVYPVPLERAIPDYAAPVADVGQSYLSVGGVSFTDLHAEGGSWTNTSICIKAVAAPDPGQTPSVLIVGRPWVELGGKAVLSAFTAGMTGDLSYQWHKGAQPIPGEVLSSYTIPVVDESHAGQYYLHVEDESKALFVSPPFTLEVLPQGSIPAYGAATLLALAITLASLGTRARKQRR